MKKQWWMIEGEWIGYRSSQDRVVHRHYTDRRKEAEGIEALGYGIRFTDGTTLALSVKPHSGRKVKPVINGYSSLIADCRFYKVSSVDGLEAERAKLRAAQAERMK